MKNDLLNGQMYISINGPKANSSEAEKMIEKVCLKFQQTRQDKSPNVFVVRKKIIFIPGVPNKILAFDQQ